MTKDQAEIILSINEVQWATLSDVIGHERSIMLAQWENPSNGHDLDQFLKGGSAFARQVLDYKKTALKILEAEKKEGGERNVEG